MPENLNLLKSNFDPIDQIQLLRDKCNNISTHLYKVNAIYLEELRNSLPQAIRTSLFTIITDQARNDFGFSTVRSRKAFQLKIDKLVSNNISLLTIEHLNELAKTIEKENIRHFDKAKNELAQAIKTRDNAESKSFLTAGESINLSSTPPLDDLTIIDGWKAEMQIPYSFDYPDDLHKSKNGKKEQITNESNNEYEPLEDVEKKFDTFNLKGNEIDILQSIFALADESNANEVNSNKEDFSQIPELENEQKNNRLLPENPIGLYEWMISIDNALVRRLRDLSHEINGELLRSGLVNTLVPLNILDAALAGQLTSNKSVSNILTIKLPINSSSGTGGIDIDCLLITHSDLEFDNARLRKNRTYIKHYQNVLLGMIKQQRYWQGRSLAEEVSKKWWKDTKKI